MKLHHLKFWLAQVSTLFFLLTCKLTSAQIVPDTTLPVNSIATPIGNTTTITGGTQAGTNLFHSFREFSIPTDNTAFFNNALDIQNIISRITGGSISNIDGLIRANGTANLFLLNPNGFIFGLNAKLNIGGSFLASTANSLNFADGNQFSAKPVQTTPLLTVSVPIGLQLSGNTGKITVQGSEIQVPPERTLTLVGSDITLTGSNLTAQRGRIELVSLVSGNWPLINSPAQITDKGGISTEYGDIQLSQQAIVDASGLGGGNIQVRGRRISLTDGSQIRANTQGAELAGNVTVRASDTLELIGVGNLAEQGENIVQPSAISTETTSAGNAGNLEIVTGRLIVRDGSQVSASTSGTGNGGSLRVIANDIELIGRSPDGTIPSGILARVERGATGNAGDVLVVTDNLRVVDGARLTAGSLGQGNAGSLNVQAQMVEITGVGTNVDGTSNPAQVSTSTSGSGKGGNLQLSTNSLVTRSGGQVAASTYTDGDGGILTINANNIDLIGRSPDGTIPSGILARVERGATGNAGDANVVTGNLRVSDGARLTAGSLGQGNAGSLNVQAQMVEITGVGTNVDGTSNPAQVSTSTSGSGKGGNLQLSTNSLVTRSGGQVAASTYTDGDGGILTINANNIDLIGRSPDGTIPSGILARVERGATGNAGDANVVTGNLRVSDGARLTAGSLGQGNAGSLNVQAQMVQITGVGTNVDGTSNPAQVSTSTSGSGKGGNLQLSTNSLVTRNGGQVAASTYADGDGGILTINANNIDLIGQSPDGSLPSGLLARVESGAMGNAGDVIINTGSLSVKDGAGVGVASLGQGNAGSLTIRATDGVEITGVGSNSNGTPNPAQISALSTGSGDAGTLDIEADSFIVGDRAEAIVSSTGSGNPGNLIAAAPFILIRDLGSLRAESVTGKAGNIDLRSRTLQLRGQAQISAVSASGTAEGNITINTETLVLLEGSQVRTDAQNPQGGSNITIAPLLESGLAVFQSLDSIIKPSGELRVEGQVEISPPDIPSVDVVDSTRLIVQACPAVNEDNTFFVTGRGGLPPSPDDILSGDIFWEDLRIPSVLSSQSSAVSGHSSIATDKGQMTNDKIVEAQGWIIGSNGEVILTAQAPKVTPHGTPLTPPNCQF